MSEYVRIHVGEWAYLYIDGKLDVAGDSYLSDDVLAAALGVEEIYLDDSNTMGRTYQDRPLTLSDARQRIEIAKIREHRARELRAEIARLEIELEEVKR